MYTREQKENALAMYYATQSIADVIRRLGYPSKQALYTIISDKLQGKNRINSNNIDFFCVLMY